MCCCLRKEKMIIDEGEVSHATTLVSFCLNTHRWEHFPHKIFFLQQHTPYQIYFFTYLDKPSVCYIQGGPVRFFLTAS